MIPQEIIDEYNLLSIVEEDGWCYAEIRKAVYGLKEASYLSNVELKQGLFQLKFAVLHDFGFIHLNLSWNYKQLHVVVIISEAYRNN